MGLSQNYITGLCEWAGSFTYSYSPGKGGITLYFGIRSSTRDLTLLLKVRDFFEVGKVYRGGQGQKKWAYFRVNKLGDLIKIARHFEQHPLISVKQHAFEIWKEMVACKRRKLPKDRTRILELAERISRQNSR